MKMLNAIDSAKLPEGAASDAALAEGLGLLLRVLYPVVPHITWQLWRDLGFAHELGDLLDAPGRMWTKPRWWPTRSNSCSRSMASCAARSAWPPRPPRKKSNRSPSPRKKSPASKGRPPKRVIVVPGKLVNVVG